MFHAVTLRGGEGAVLSGYRTAATLTAWTITKRDGAWSLRAVCARTDAYQLRQRNLFFSAPRARDTKGFWYWPVIPPIVIERGILITKLEHPQQ